MASSSWADWLPSFTTTKDVVTIVTAIIGTLVAVAGYFFVRRRRVGWEVTVEGEPESYSHTLFVLVTNRGVELQNVSVVIEFTDWDGKVQRSDMTADHGNPVPVKFWNTCRFYLTNNDPTVDLQPLMNRKTVRLEVFAGPSRVKRVSGRKWEHQMKAFAKADPSRPPKSPDSSYVNMDAFQTFLRPRRW